MSRGKRRSVRRQKESGRPSLFFIVALAIGVALIFWLFAMTLRHPTPARHSSLSRFAALQAR